jgi:hypothetical protein
MSASLAVAATLTLALLGGTASAIETSEFKLVIHASNPLSEISAKELSKVFLGRKSSLGGLIRPVDLVPDSPVRESFSREVHARSVALIKSYWRRQIFSGRLRPPRELGDDREVLAFVGSNVGAVGYVSRQTNVGPNVKVVGLVD